MKFSKYHGLGNDYIVLAPQDFPNITPHQIRVICHRHFGIGSDGILWGPFETDDDILGLRIYNPDGSEAEKSGNGIRIFARSLWDQGRVSTSPFYLRTPGGDVCCRMMKDGQTVQVDMGQVSFSASRIPTTGPDRDVLNETIDIDGTSFVFCAASIGNPHCVIPCDKATAAMARTLGPRIETDARFPKRINVQFMEIVDRENIRIEIWERGAGYTLASGSSSCAAAAVAVRLGHCDRRLHVHMPGGQLLIEMDEMYRICMTGPVTRIAEGRIFPEMLDPDKSGTVR